MSFSWSNLDYPSIICSPMDGITDYAFREVISKFGGSAVLYTEFTNVNAIIKNKEKIIRTKLKFSENQRPIIAQLFGADPNIFLEASNIVANLGFDAIDINMGCPAKKVAHSGAGCALMGDLDRALNILKSTIEGANLGRKNESNKLEVSIKTRLGICDKETIFDFGMQMLNAGASAIAIHGRTLKQMYTGKSDWDYIKKFVILKNNSININKKIPVIGSGDVKSLFDAFIMFLYSGVDAIMIGRGSLGRPWIFDKFRVDKLKEIIFDTIQVHKKSIGDFNLEEIFNLPNINKIKDELDNPKLSYKDIVDIAVYHSEIMYENKGLKGIVEMRKHLGWYFVGFDGAKDLRIKLLTVNTLDQIKNLLFNYSKNINVGN